ncbi:MAG: RluA family pseudouridine synthase [Gemmataceae bacterium]
MNDQQFIINRGERGQTLASVLKHRLTMSWSQARQMIERRRVRLAGQVCADAVRRVQPGQRVEVISDKPARRSKPRTEPKKPAPALPRPALVHLDDWIVVVEKPASVTTMRHAEEAAEFGPRGKHYLPPTLADALPPLVGGPVRAVHRLDRDTSGLVVFARTPEAERELGKQFRAHTIARKYLAVVRNRPAAGRIESNFVRDRGDGRRGSGVDDGDGQRAVTHIAVVEELGDFTLMECRLETGRTHQVRIHLGELGTPICGETIYDRPLHGAPVADDSSSARLALHAALLGLHHPETREWMEWESPLPDDLNQLVSRLRLRRDAVDSSDTSDL